MKGLAEMLEAIRHILRPAEGYSPPIEQQQLRKVQSLQANEIKRLQELADAEKRLRDYRL